MWSVAVLPTQGRLCQRITITFPAVHLSVLSVLLVKVVCVWPSLSLSLLSIGLISSAYSRPPSAHHYHFPCCLSVLSVLQCQGRLCLRITITFPAVYQCYQFCYVKVAVCASLSLCLLYISLISSTDFRSFLFTQHYHYPCGLCIFKNSK